MLARWIRSITSTVNQLDASVLVEMGFSRERVEEALKATKNSVIFPELEWLLSHPVAEATSGNWLARTMDAENSANNHWKPRREQDQWMQKPHTMETQVKKKKKCHNRLYPWNAKIEVSRFSVRWMLRHMLHGLVTKTLKNPQNKSNLWLRKRINNKKKGYKSVWKKGRSKEVKTKKIKIAIVKFQEEGRGKK